MISKPEQLTYFICRDGEQYQIKAYGSVDTTQEMVTPHPVIDTYLDKDEWIAKLLEGGITIESNEDI